MSTRAFAPAMIARIRKIAFITSPASYLAWPNASAYIAARRAVAGFAETLQGELNRTGLSVTLVVLGTVETPMGAQSRQPGEPAEDRSQARADAHRGRGGRGDRRRRGGEQSPSWSSPPSTARCS